MVGDLRNSVLRYFLNNFCDGRVQDAWDIFMGRYVPERGRLDGGGRAVRQSSSATACAAHLASPTPTSLLLRFTATWVGLSLTLAVMIPRLGGAWGLWRGTGSAPGATGGSGAWGAGGGVLLGLIPVPTPRQLLVGGLLSLATLVGVGMWVLAKGAPPKLVKALVNRPSFVGREVTREEKQSWW